METPLLVAAKWISCEEKDFFSKSAVQIVLKLKGVDLSMILGHSAKIERQDQLLAPSVTVVCIKF